MAITTHQPLQVLFLDDEKELCEFFQDYFETSDFKISTFSQVHEAVAFSKKRNPDLIFLDYRLPGVLGDQVAREMPDHIPKILLTGEIAITTSYPFEQIIEKPFEVSDIERLLRHYQSRLSKQKVRDA
ncbi:MAG: response regulator [Bradymonadales bacterium]|nr:MAG: response regulator [Bradymonadales bacterium]